MFQEIPLIASFSGSGDAEEIMVISKFILINTQLSTIKTFYPG